MISNKSRIRKDFAPLTVAVSIKCTTPASPTTQTYNSENLEYEPDRGLTPTVLLPVVAAIAADGTWNTPSANTALADMKWYVNGVDISTLTSWSGKYSIDTSDSETRGAITIKRNIAAGELAELHFSANIVDSRLGVLIPIVTDKILLSTAEKSGDTYSISIDDSAILQYDPLKDNLLLYDYKVAHGVISESATAKEDATDKNAYLHTIPFSVYCGVKKLTSGYTVNLYRVDGVNKLTQLTTADAEIEALTSSSVTLDLRLIKKSSYTLKVFVDNTEVAMTEFGVNRIFPTINISPTNGTAIHPSDTTRFDKVMVSSNGNIVEYPCRGLKIVWFTESTAKTVKHNEGETTLFKLADTGIGNTYSDCVLDVYCEAEYKDAYSVAIDADGNTLVDSDGNTFIFN